MKTTQSKSIGLYYISYHLHVILFDLQYDFMILHPHHFRRLMSWFCFSLFLRTTSSIVAVLCSNTYWLNSLIFFGGLPLRACIRVVAPYRALGCPIPCLGGDDIVEASLFRAPKPRYSIGPLKGPPPLIIGDIFLISNSFK